MIDKTEKTDKIEIVKLVLSQWQEYRAIRLDALKTEPQAFLSTYARESSWIEEKWMGRLQETSGKGSWLLFARNETGELVGMIGGYRDSNDLENHSAQIWGVYVKHEERGKGIAKILMNGILEEFKTEPDIETAILEVNTDQKSAQKLYASFGFEVTKTYQTELGDGQDHEITEMRKSLSND